MKRTKVCMRKMTRKSNRAVVMALALPLSAGGALAGFSGAALPLGIGAALCLSAAAPLGAATTPVERVAEGEVVSKSDQPLPGAVVFLKDVRTQAIRTFICDAAGHFHFGQLGQNTDYEVWAQSNGQRSRTRSISSFDSRNNFNFTLKINTGG